MSDPCAELAAYLASAGLPYHTLSPLGGATAQVRFLGVFQGQAVAWNAEILTLGAYDQEQMRRAPTPLPVRTWRQFIEIGAQAELGVALRVGLAVPRIDAATVLRTIVMIRNYNRLRQGGHEFGDGVTFADG